MPGSLKYETMVDSLIVFKTFSDKYLCHQPAINAQSFSNYLSYVLTTGFYNDETHPYLFEMGYNQSQTVNLEFRLDSVTEMKDGASTIVYPMFNNIVP